jgi:two-component system OmpR family response regulator
MIELKQILYVEDEPDIRDIAQLALEAIGGFEVTLCESGKEALKALSHFRPQLILLDVMMPGMDGPTTFSAIRELPRGRDIPVIFMTAKVQAHEIAAYKAMGSIGVISKPFDAMLLASQIQELWENRHG